MATSLRDLLDRVMAEPVPEAVVPRTVNSHLEHIPVILLIDTSSSMEGAKIEAVNAAMAKFVNDINFPSNSAVRAVRDQGDFAIIRYGAEVALEATWTHGSDLQPRSPFKAAGGTPMGEAILLAGDMLLNRFRAYKRDDAHALCGAVFNLTDGGPTDMDPAGMSVNGTYSQDLKDRWDRAREVIRIFEEAGSSGHSYVQFFHLGVPGFDAEKMQQLSIKPDRVYPIDSNIASFFDFVKLSLAGLGEYPTIAEAIAARLSKKP